MSYHLLPSTTTADEKQRNASIAVLPVGSFEQHGEYLPLATDTVIASTISAEIANAYPVLMLPPITISCSHEHSAWPGTVSISARTLYAVVTDIYESVTAGTPDTLVLVNGHGGNYVLSNVVQEATAARRRMALFPSIQDVDEARAAAGLVTSAYEDMHAGELETSILLHTHPELVRAGYDRADWVNDDRRQLLSLGMQAYTESGVIGRPSLASAEKGKALLGSFVQNFRSVQELFSE